MPQEPRPEPQPPPASKDGAPPPPPADGEETLDLSVERIDTEGVLKEGFAGQEM